jgi:dihydrofolate synthase/folylpolyglutamate synthase
MSLVDNMVEEVRFDAAMDYIYGLEAFGWKLGLERFTALCERLGNPQDRLRVIHVGGTNGKGSTTAMISSILKAAGHKVGSYYSPYMYNIRERIQVDGLMIDKSAFTRLVDEIKPHVEAIGLTDLGHPTEFEVKTAIAFLYFAEEDVDFAVMEVGLGGRLDATNIVNPLVSVITNVTRDHTDRLGETIPEIASEKAGIIKENGITVTSALDIEALNVISEACEARKAMLWHVHPSKLNGNHFCVTPVVAGKKYIPSCGDDCGANGSNLLYVEGMMGNYADLMVGMKGRVQFSNAALSLAAVEALAFRGLAIPEQAIREGLACAYLPGRLEVLRRNPTLIIDGAHNLDSARNLAEALKNNFEYSRLILVMGMVRGHSVSDVVGSLAPLADMFVATSPESDRAKPALDIAVEAMKYCSDVFQVEPVTEAVAVAMSQAGPNDLVCATGSFYTIGEIARPE